MQGNKVLQARKASEPFPAIPGLVAQVQGRGEHYQRIELVNRTTGESVLTLTGKIQVMELVDAPVELAAVAEVLNDAGILA